MMTPRRLGPEDAGAYLAIRREMLEDSPWAFLSSPDDDLANGVETLAVRLAEAENAILGVERGGVLVSVAGVYRSPRAKSRHRANVWGVYTTPRLRGQGLGHRVVQSAVAVAWGWEGVDQVALSCSARAAAALAVYRDLGFVSWGVEPGAMKIDGEHLDEVHFVLHREV
ncbi:MAG: GNAT family N-acetyltransferase [Phycisphaerales bacterium JB040]